MDSKCRCYCSKHGRGFNTSGIGHGHGHRQAWMGTGGPLLAGFSTSTSPTRTNNNCHYLQEPAINGNGCSSAQAAKATITALLRGCSTAGRRVACPPALST
jgi:hypothetical protein